jgi:hypothetical protein
MTMRKYYFADSATADPSMMMAVTFAPDGAKLLSYASSAMLFQYFCKRLPNCNSRGIEIPLLI